MYGFCGIWKRASQFSNRMCLAAETSQPDSHPGSQLVSAQCSVLGPLSSILNPESSLFGAQLAGRHQMK